MGFDFDSGFFFSPLCLRIMEIFGLLLMVAEICGFGVCREQSGKCLRWICGKFLIWVALESTKRDGASTRVFGFSVESYLLSPFLRWASASGYY